MKGYEGFFDQKKVTERNRVAMSSIGTTLEATRFYFADAAVQQAYTKDVDPGGDLFHLSNRFLKTVLHVALRGFVEAYHAATVHVLRGAGVSGTTTSIPITAAIEAAPRRPTSTERESSSRRNVLGY